MRRFLATIVAVMLCAQTAPAQESQSALRSKINHVIVIYQENWSFDGLYGKFPGANGLNNANATVKQVDKQGDPYATLPQPYNTNSKSIDDRIPAGLPVAPFDLSKYVPAEQKTGDMVHRYYQEQYQIDGGKMDKFAAISDGAGLVLGYYDATTMPEGKLAAQYTLMDNFFHSAFGGSFLNHFWLVCACTPVWPNAPADRVAQLDASGVMTKDGAVTPDGFAINTAFTVNSPHPKNITDPALLLPQQTMATIGDRLDGAGVSWAWYSGGWNDAIAGNADPLFQYHHQVFAFFGKYADGTPGRAQHLRDEKDFFTAVASGNVPSVVFIKPLGPDNEHPGYASLRQGQDHVAQIVAAVQKSPIWKDTAIIITYDENGGRWDHVAPPVIDKWGPGLRVPAILISPFAKRHFVDHTQYETVSILKLIETRWNLAPLSDRDTKANGMLSAFDFTQR